MDLGLWNIQEELKVHVSVPDVGADDHRVPSVRISFRGNESKVVESLVVDDGNEQSESHKHLERLKRLQRHVSHSHLVSRCLGAGKSVGDDEVFACLDELTHEPELLAEFTQEEHGSCSERRGCEQQNDIHSPSLSPVFGLSKNYRIYLTKSQYIGCFAQGCMGA